MTILIQDIRSPQHKAGSIIFVYHVLLATFCGSRSVGSSKLVTCKFCGCSLDVDLIFSQEATVVFLYVEAK